MYNRFGYKLPIGRDRFVELAMQSGYRVRYPKSYKRATQAGTRMFPNLLVGKVVSGVNQVWQGDMAHYLVGNKTFYTIYLTDVYSQEIVGYGAFESNDASSYISVLQQAIRKTKGYTGTSLEGLIHHSDGGKQYESKDYRRLCVGQGIKQSMCRYSWENPYAEKTNDLINNGYLNAWKPRTLRHLKSLQAKAVKDHNHCSSKRRLKGLSPCMYRQQLINNPNENVHELQLKPVYPKQPSNHQTQLLTLSRH